LEEVVRDGIDTCDECPLWAQLVVPWFGFSPGLYLRVEKQLNKL